jgi:hypothetical protein
MGDDTPFEVIGQGRVEIPHKIFENVFHVPKIFVNILSIYQITHYGIGKRAEFTPNSVTISDIHDKYMIFVGEVNHQFHLCTCSKFIAKSDYALLLMHANDTSILWHKRFDHLNFKYIKKICK